MGIIRQFADPREPVDLRQPETRLRLGGGILGPKSPIMLLRPINGLGSMTWYNE